jgi:hypothetical protein
MAAFIRFTNLGETHRVSEVHTTTILPDGSIEVQTMRKKFLFLALNSAAEKRAHGNLQGTGDTKKDNERQTSRRER